MRKLALFLSLAFCFQLTASSQDPKPPAKKIIREGSVLTYHVKSFGKEYDFIVTVNKISSLDGVSFDWKMTDPANKSGSISITDDAYTNSYAWYNMFSNGSVKLDKETSVF